MEDPSCDFTHFYAVSSPIMRAAVIFGSGLTKRQQSVPNSTSTSNPNSSSLQNNENTFNSPSPSIRSRALIRPPLSPRDGNTIMRQHAPLAAKSGGNAKTMPPLKPVLSASAKSGNRTPLTPRVAVSTPIGASTPLSRRAPRSEVGLPQSREDLSTSALLGNNITPRSGQRKVRVDSANTTPTGTPTGASAPQSSKEPLRIAQDPPPSYGTGLGINGTDRDIPKRPTVTVGSQALDMAYTRSPLQSDSGDSKFFFASDAKAGQASRPQAPPAKSPAAFFYANGDVISPPPKNSGGCTIGSTIGGDRSKFYHINGIPDFQIPPTPHFPPKAPSTVSTSSRMTSPNLGANTSTLKRPSSPVKSNSNTPLPSLKSAATLPSPILPRPLPGGRGQSSSSIVSSRKASREAPQKAAGHSRNTSIGSPDPIALHKRVSSVGSSFEVPSSSMALNLITSYGSVTTSEEMHDETESGLGTPSDIQSPIKAGNSLEKMNELAANARRERKVLDLEITNSSLAAINRTLEREMRKQTAELRRFRRLSRTGRLSIAASTSRRAPKSELSTVDGSEAGASLSDMSEEENELDQEEEESDFDSEDESADDGTLSPTAMAASDARHREKDEKRLKIDLSKHQQLLIDSQKMNQSLKRCLGLSEELINEGKKAIAYTVRISDVEIGGRVLAPEDMEEDDNEGMSDIGASLLRQARKAAKAAWGNSGREDRDSGIEVDGPLRSPSFET